ncbi:HutD family protein [Herbaspirillum sp. alder98]|uniref:HutD/Ves family protein n=1 Tax=Herbaspirillum sp. alder98 TaxID=2913096 RepID=UPI001CD855B4|nr:HutD family protein [Herbaspirillum sp. alder98]MCA1323661.1 HutD family protein [Herbaspirillum sp. alder98]
MAVSTLVAASGSLGAITAMPWKNGGGATRELHVEPPGADYADFVWRASVADVVRDGAFSSFDGIDRTIVLLGGDGFVMHAQGQPSHDLRTPFAPHRFTGEAHISVVLDGSPCQDFNLMVRRDQAEAELQVLGEQDSPRLPPDTVLLYVAQGAASLSDADGLQHPLGSGEFARLREGGAMPDLHCATGAVVLAVRVRRR